MRPCWCSRGKPVGIFRTHKDAPRVLIANSNLVPPGRPRNILIKCSEGLIMYGQMTAGSWIYIGTQGILQGRMKRSHLWLCTKELEFSQGEICANRWV